MAKKAKKSAFKGRVKKDSEKQKSQGNSFGYLSLPKGVSVYSPTPGSREKIDIIPYTVSIKNHPDIEEGYPSKGDIWYKRPFKIHRNVGADNDAVVCLTSFGKKCPICEHSKSRRKAGADKDELKAYNASQRNLYVVVPRGVKKVDEDLHIFDMSQYLFQNLLNEELEENDTYEVFPDLEEGYTLKVRWAEESFAGNKFAEASRIDFLKRKDTLEEELGEEAPNLDKCLKELTYEEMEAKFFEDEVEPEVEEEEEEEKAPFGEEEEEEKPKRKKAAPKKAAPKKEEELEWDDLSDMDLTELCDVIEERELDVDPDDYDKASELMEAIAEELEIEVPEEEEEEEEEEEKPKRKKATKEKADTLTEDGIYKMTRKELEKLVKSKKLDIDLEDFEDDEELADEIIIELDL